MSTDRRETREDSGAQLGSSEYRRWRAPLAAVLVLTFFVYLTLAGSWRLRGSTEPMYGLIVRHIVETGEILVLKQDGELYREKPPIWFWAAALAGEIRGEVDDVAVRMPSVISTVGILFVLAVLGGRLLGDRRTGILAALVFATSIQVLEHGHRGRVDPVLTFFTTAGSLVFLAGLIRQRTGLRPYAAAWLLIGLGLLTKGPPALIPPLLAVSAYALARRDPSVLRKIAPLRGLGLSALVALLWLVPWIHATGLDEAKLIWTRQIVDRTASDTIHQEPAHYYLLQFPFRFLPWSLLIPLIAAAWWRCGRPIRSMRITLFLWFAAGLLLFSAFGSKRPSYLLPFYPAAALLVADHLRRLGDLGWVGRISASIVAALPLAAGFVFAYLQRLLPGSDPILGVGAVVLGATVTVLVIVAAHRGRVIGAMTAAAIALLALLAPAGAAFARHVDANFSISPLAEESLRHGGDVLVLYGSHRKARTLAWLTDREWRPAEDSRDIENLRRSGSLLIVMREDRSVALPDARIVASIDCAGRRYILTRID